MTKTETLEQYLARGGKIEVVPAVEPEDNGPTVRKTAVTAPTLYHITEGAILFGEKKKTKKSKTKTLSKSELEAKMKSFRTEK